MVLQSKGFLSTALVDSGGGYAWLIGKGGQTQAKTGMQRTRIR